MKCPVYKHTDLVLSERQKIEIDYCPDCRGVWLDRGELDKIIERANEGSGDFRKHYSEKRKEYSSSAHYYGKRYKKKSFFNNIFGWD